MKYYILLVSLFLIVGCKKNKKIKAIKKNKYATQPISQQHKIYQVYVEGVECEDCSQLAIEAAEKVTGTISATFEHPDSYENGHLQIVWDSAVLFTEHDLANKLEDVGFGIKKVSAT